MTQAVGDSACVISDDATLLRQFAQTRTDAPFAELMRRHGPLVWGVCRRRLHRVEDAEDAFQMTFLMLALKAATVRRPEALAGWLHRVACRVAGRAATAAPAEPPTDITSTGTDAFAELARAEMAGLLDEEVSRLPTRLRDPLVLFHLQGLSRQDVADRLGVSEQAVKSLLTRARARLRTRLARRGVALSTLIALCSPAPLRAEVLASAGRLAVAAARGGWRASDLLSLSIRGLRPMTWFPNKSAAAVAAGVACLTLFLLTRDPAADTAAPGVGVPPLDAGYAVYEEHPAEPARIVLSGATIRLASAEQPAALPRATGEQPPAASATGPAPDPYDPTGSWERSSASPFGAVRMMISDGRLRLEGPVPGLAMPVKIDADYKMFDGGLLVGVIQSVELQTAGADAETALKMSYIQSSLIEQPFALRIGRREGVLIVKDAKLGVMGALTALEDEEIGILYTSALLGRYETTTRGADGRW